MNPRLIPRLYVSPRVSQRTRLWWQDIGRSLMAFTEVEIFTLDWAVILLDEKSWWLSH